MGADVALWNFFAEGNCQPFHTGSRGRWIGFWRTLMLSSPLPSELLPSCFKTAASYRNLLWRYAPENVDCSDTKHKSIEAVIDSTLGSQSCLAVHRLNGAEWLQRPNGFGFAA